MMDVHERAAITAGGSASAIHARVSKILLDRHTTRGTLIDIGCGTACIWSHLRNGFDRYVGVDVLKHEGFPDNLDFVEFDLETGRVPFQGAAADSVLATEVIEHVENPRAFFRELVRLVNPGGLIVVSTPNQNSWLSIVSLMVKGHFDAFTERPGCYPAHITALLETDLIRIAKECNLTDLTISYSDSGRIPLLTGSWPRFLKGKRFSDNIIMTARKQIVQAH